MLKQSIFVAVLTAGLVAVAGSAFAADVAAGKATFEETCASCHELNDWQGKSTAELTTMIEDVVSGKTKHKKAIKLTSDQIANVAAFATGAK